MSEQPYTSFIHEKEGKILRDYLAIDRTILANETSFMSYVRTALTLIAAGATVIKFFDNPAMQILGWAFVIVGGWLAFHGYNRYRQVDNIMHKVKGDYSALHTKHASKYKGVLSWPVKLFKR
jgi:putative membrane protein